MVKNLVIFNNFFFFFKKYIYFSFVNFKLNIFFFFIKKKYLIEFTYILKKNLLFKYLLLMDLTVIDFFISRQRFLLYYNYLNIFFNYRFYLYFYIDNLFNDFFFMTLKNFINSVSNIFLNALWLEREIWDMFGIFFYNHLDLRRILTDYGFNSFPLRKDFPLTGFYEIRYDENLKIIVYESLNLIQEYRIFNFINPWK